MYLLAIVIKLQLKRRYFMFLETSNVRLSTMLLSREIVTLEVEI